jgi:hypothetical protein
VVGEDFITDSIHNGRLANGRRAYYRIIGAPKIDIPKNRMTSTATAVNNGNLTIKKTSKEAITLSPQLSPSAP